MKIFILTSPWIALPPRGYGGSELVVYNLSEKLTQRGHKVTLFAAGNSRISSELKYFYPKNLGLDTVRTPNYLFLFLNHIYYALKNLPSDTDIIHNHCEYPAMYFLESLNKPFLHTLHSGYYKNLDKDLHSVDKYGESIRNILDFFKHHPFVSISDYQRKGKPDLNYVGTIYNGINIEYFTYEDTSLDCISWLGKYSPLKGLDIAIDVAKKTGKNIMVSAYVSKDRQEMFDKTVGSKINHNVTSIGEVQSHQKKNRFLGKSKLFIFPIQWEEPFGLVMIEAMACGTPVVAYARGSVPEVIKDGETGFIVNSSPDEIRGNFIIKKTGIEGLCEAVERIYSMPEDRYREMRKACRAHVEKNFTVERMVDDYEKVYRNILKR